MKILQKILVLTLLYFSKDSSTSPVYRFEGEWNSTITYKRADEVKIILSKCLQTFLTFIKSL